MDPIFETQDAEWYFYTETWADAIGPFDSRADAEVALAQYVEDLG